MGAKKTEIQDLWTFDDLKKYLKVSQSTIYQYITQGKIPYVQVGRHKRFIPAEVERAVKRFAT